jgi:Tfp pilus assembly protein PilN
MIEVNLHPHGPKRSRRGRRLPSPAAWFKGSGDGRDPWAIAAIAIPALVLLVVGLLWLSQRGERHGLEERLTEAVDDSTRLADLRALSDSLMARESQIRERLDLIQGLDDGRFVWPRVMDELSRALPHYTWLTAIRQSSPLPDLRVQIDGMAANPLAITAFVRQLQQSPYVGQVRILGSQEQLVDGFSAHSFKLVVAYAQPPDSLVRLMPVGAGGS